MIKIGDRVKYTYNYVSWPGKFDTGIVTGIVTEIIDDEFFKVKWSDGCGNGNFYKLGDKVTLMPKPICPEYLKFKDIK